MADIDRDRHRRDAAGIGPYARDAEQLVALRDLGGWHVAEGEPDIRGWEVRTIGGKDLGKVKDLLVDPQAGEVVMIDVDLSASDQHALVPLRIVQIDRVARTVRMDSADLSPETGAAAEASGEREVERAPGRQFADTGNVRYPAVEGERVVERRPVVEEVVVRRRLLDPEERMEEADAADAAGEGSPREKLIDGADAREVERDDRTA